MKFALTEFDDRPEKLASALWHDDRRKATLGVIDEEERDGGDDGDRQLVPPANVKQVVE